MVLKNGVRYSLTSSFDDNCQRLRKEHLATFTPMTRRVAALGLHNLTVRYPAVAAVMLGLDLATIQAGYVGAGYRSVVLRNGEGSVTKLHLDTVSLSAADKSADTHERRMHYAAMRGALPAFMLPQLSFIDAHPATRNRPVVQTEQPYHANRKIRFLKPYDNSIDPKALEEFYSEEPVAAAQLPDFVAGCVDLYDQTGYVPDITGYGNVIVSTETDELLLVDGQPLLPCDTSHSYTMTRIEQLGEHVAALA